MIVSAVLTTGLAAGAIAQSNSQDFPTPITANEISGTIKPRDLGDSRLTTYYFALGGEQGDLFINLVTRNLTGDIDVFTANGLKPLTKIVVYADYGEAETGRAIYLRKPERLLLRVQGRTPNDDEATFRLKFAGSFAALRPEDVPAAPEPPKVASTERGGVKVNAAGTILPSPPETIAAAESKADTEPSRTEKPGEAAPEPKADTEVAVAKPETAASDPVNTAETPKPETRRRSASSRRRTPPRAKPTREEDAKTDTAAEGSKPEAATPDPEKTTTAKPARRSSPGFRTLTDRRAKSNKKTEAPEPDPLESINLVIQFKDGRTLEKKMSEVFKFSVDKGVLTVVLKDGQATRYPIVDVARLTIE